MTKGLMIDIFLKPEVEQNQTFKLDGGASNEAEGCSGWNMNQMYYCNCLDLQAVLNKRLEKTMYQTLTLHM